MHNLNFTILFTVYFFNIIQYGCQHLFYIFHLLTGTKSQSKISSVMPCIFLDIITHQFINQPETINCSDIISNFRFYKVFRAIHSLI